MKHTPAPWHVRTDSIWGNPVPQGQAVHHTTVACNINNPADRVLISAAPDLLAALIKLEAHADTLQSMLPDKAADAVFRDILAARDAIAKATTA